MTKVYSLFSDQKEAGKAITNLSEAGLDDSDTYTIEDWDTGRPAEPISTPIHAGHAASAVTVPPIKTVVPDLDLDDEAERFIMQTLKKGGVMIVVEPSGDEERERAERILEEAGGQVAA